MKIEKWLRCSILLMLFPLVTSGYEAVPQEALVGQWFNGPQNSKDQSGYTPAGTHDAIIPPPGANGNISATPPPGFSGYALWLNYAAAVITNSSTSHAGYVNTFDEQLTNQFTVSFWAKNANNWQNWAHKTDNSSAGWRVYYLGDGSGNGNFLMYSPAAQNCLGVLDTVNQWHHYALVWSRSDGARWLYQDGNLINSATNAGMSFNLAKGNALQYGGSGNLYLFDYRVYKQKMSQAQVQNIMTVQPVMSNGSVGEMGDVTINGTNVTLRVDYANPLTNLSLSYSVGGGGTGSPASGTAVDFSQGPVTYTLTSTNGMAQIAYSVSAQRLPNPKNALVGRWLASSANLRDYSDYAPAGVHDGIAANGTVSFSTNVPAGFHGSSLVCAESASYVRINNSANTDAGYLTTFDNTLSNQFTVAFWAKGLPSSWQQYVGKSAGSPSRGWAIAKDGDQGTNQIFYVYGISNPAVTTMADMNNWHHFVLVWDQSNAVRRIYIDGVVTNVSNTAGQNYTPCPDQPLGLGSGRLFGFGGFWLYDVRIYKQIMFKAEVDQIRTVPDYPLPKGTMIMIL